MIDAILIRADRKRIYERHNLGRLQKIAVKGATLPEQPFEELEIGKSGKPFVFLHAVCERKGQPGIASRKIRNAFGVHLTELRVTPPYQRFGDFVSFGLYLNNGSDLGPVFLDIVFDGDELEAHCSQDIFCKRRVNLCRAVVEHQYRRTFFGLEPFEHLARARNRPFAEVGIERRMSVERLIAHSGLEQRLNNSGRANARKADNAHRFVASSDKFPYSVYSIFDPVLACVGTRKLDGNAVPADQLVILTRRHEGPSTEGSPSFEGYAEPVANP